MSDEYTRQLDELLAAARGAGLTTLGPTDPRFTLGRPGIVVQAPLDSKKLYGIRETKKYTFCPAGAKHTIIELRGSTL